MSDHIGFLVTEYLAYVKDTAAKGQDIDWSKLLDLLCAEGDWTPQGAEQLISVVRDQGGFFLKNAYALALAANIEDGRLEL